MENKAPVSVYSEFQRLEKIIVGSPYPPSYFDAVEDSEAREGLQKIAYETEEDCNKLSQIFRDFGAEVLRPQNINPLFKENGKKCLISDGRWESAFPNTPLWPRDLTLALGTKLASVYSRNLGRWVEGQAFYSILFEQFQKGADWVSMPPPVLNQQAESYSEYGDNSLLGHAACFLKCGKDVFHSQPGDVLKGGRGTKAGLEWVKRQFPEFEFHPFNMTGHIDGKIALLKPGLVLSWVEKDMLPTRLQNWETIRLTSKEPLPEEFVKLRSKRFYKDFIVKWLNEWIGSVDETYFDVNVVSLDEKTVVLNSTNLDLMRQLESRGIECIPFDFRHRHFWDGGLHCMTLDLRRHGPMENYFS